MRGSVDKDFKEKINGRFLCLISAAICHTLRAWQTGVYVEPRDFKRETSLGMLKVPDRTRIVADRRKRSLEASTSDLDKHPGQFAGADVEKCSELDPGNDHAKRRSGGGKHRRLRGRP